MIRHASLIPFKWKNKANKQYLEKKEWWAQFIQLSTSRSHRVQLERSKHEHDTSIEINGM